MRSDERRVAWCIACVTLAVASTAGCCFDGAPSLPSRAPTASAQLARAPAPPPSPTSPAAAPSTCAPATRASSLPPASVRAVLTVTHERAAALSALCAGMEHAVVESVLTTAIDACARTLGVADMRVTACAGADDCCGLTLHTGRGTPGADDDGDWVVVEGPADAMHPLSLVSVLSHGRVADYTPTEPFDPIANPNCTPEGIATPWIDGDDGMIPDGFTPVDWDQVGPGVRALVCQRPG